MLIGDDPWFKVRATVLGRSSVALKVWLCACPGNDTGRTFTGRLTCIQKNTDEMMTTISISISRLLSFTYSTTSSFPIGLVLLLGCSESPDGKSTEGFVGGVLGCLSPAAQGNNKQNHLRKKLKSIEYQSEIVMF